MGLVKETSALCVPMGPSGSGKDLGNVPRMLGTWPVCTWASFLSSASWCLHFRKCRCCSLCFSVNGTACLPRSSTDCRQYYSSCKTGNMDSALSIWFLLLWLAGDTCNLVGSFLADQLPLQVTCSDKMIDSTQRY